MLLLLLFLLGRGRGWGCSVHMPIMIPKHKNLMLLLFPRLVHLPRLLLPRLVNVILRLLYLLCLERCKRIGHGHMEGGRQPDQYQSLWREERWRTDARFACCCWQHVREQGNTHACMPGCPDDYLLLSTMRAALNARLRRSAIIRRVHVSSKREQQATASRGTLLVGCSSIGGGGRGAGVPVYVLDLPAPARVFALVELALAHVHVHFDHD